MDPAVQSVLRPFLGLCGHILLWATLGSPWGRCALVPNFLRPFLTTFNFQFSCAFWLNFEFWRRNLALFSGNLATSNLTKPAPWGRISKFDPLFDAPGSVLFSALRINILQRVWKPLSHFFWNWEQNESTKCRSKGWTLGRSTVSFGNSSENPCLSGSIQNYAQMTRGMFSPFDEAALSRKCVWSIRTFSPLRIQRKKR